MRAYTGAGIRGLFDDLPVHVIRHTQIYPGYDNLVKRRPAVGKVLRTTTYTFEHTPLKKLGLSHFLVVEKMESVDADPGTARQGKCARR